MIAFPGGWSWEIFCCIVPNPVKKWQELVKFVTFSIKFPIENFFQSIKNFFFCKFCCSLNKPCEEWKRENIRAFEYISRTFLLDRTSWWRSSPDRLESNRFPDAFQMQGAEFQRLPGHCVERNNESLYGWTGIKQKPWNEWAMEIWGTLTSFLTTVTLMKINIRAFTSITTKFSSWEVWNCEFSATDEFTYKKKDWLIDWHTLETMSHRQCRIDLTV